MSLPIYSDLFFLNIKKATAICRLHFFLSLKYFKNINYNQKMQWDSLGILEKSLPVFFLPLTCEVNIFLHLKIIINILQ